MAPIIVAGMHRSGTSFLARYLEKIGVHMGDNLIPADQNNSYGYFEDKDVVELNRHFLARSSQGGSPSWKDWGWSQDASYRSLKTVDQKWCHQASLYIKKRSNKSTLWGWKDPRNTLLLENWLEIAPGAKVIGIYRYPWEVLDSLQRLTHPIFIDNPSWCLEVWNYYNTQLTQFAEQHPDQCILINSSSLLKDPLRLINILKARLELDIRPLDEKIKSEIISLVDHKKHQNQNDGDPLIDLHNECSHRSTNILKRLDLLSDLPSPRQHTFTGPKNPDRNPQKQRSELTIIITSFNQGDFLLEAIASAERHKGNRHIEIIIIDDQSTDPRTCEVLTSLHYMGYKVHRQKHGGLPKARNTGTHLAKSEIILFLDDDNRLLEPYFSKGLDYMQKHQNIDAIYGNRIEFGLRSRHIRPGKFTDQEILLENKIDNCALIRKNYLEKCGGYCEELTGLGLEDWDLWLSGIKPSINIKMAYLDLPCFEYRVRPNSMLQEILSSESKTLAAIKILQKRHGPNTGLGFLKTITEANGSANTPKNLRNRMQ